MKKILYPILALVLALGVALPMATPVLAGVTYDPSYKELSIAQGTSKTFKLTIQDVTLGETYSLLLVGIGGTKLPDGWVNAPPSFVPNEGVGTTEYNETYGWWEYSVNVKITVPLPPESDLLTYGTKIKYQTSASGCTLYVTVTPAGPSNVAPVLAPIGDKTIDEESLLSFTATATDADTPPQTLTYSLVGAPTGASINSSTGAFSWTPTEAQGPGDYTFTVRVTDNGVPALSDSEEIAVTVNEVNVAPVLAPIGDKTIDELTTLSFTATATDVDIPSNTLTYSLVGAPTGTSINSSTGAFSWTPTEAQGPGDYTFTVKVTDNGVPALSDSEEITVTVNEVMDPPVSASLVLEPASSTNVVGTKHELTATVTDQYSDPFPGATVTWTIEDGPGSFVSTETTTDSNGQARAVITSTVVGTTTIKASVSATVYDTATKKWVSGEEPRVTDSLELEPPTATNPIGTTHELIATVYDQYGDPVPREIVTWTIESGPGSFVSTETITDSHGQARAVITSTVLGTTTVKASTSATIYDTATKTWTVGLAYMLVLEPPSATNVVNTEHELIATVFDQYNNPVPDEVVAWIIEDGPGSFISLETTTDSNGQARAVITSDVTGITTIRASISLTIYDTATKTWLGAEEPIAAYNLELEPATATNEVGTNHELTATVTDQYGDPFPDETITWTIEDGPGSFVSTETTTDSNGQARAVITSTVLGTTTVKASTSVTVYDTATKTWTEATLQYFTVDFLGEITKVPMSDDGSILELLAAPNPDRTHWFEMEQGTRVLDDNGNIVTLIEIRETEDPPLEEDTVVVGNTYIIMPLNVTFSKQVRFTLGYGIDELPEDVSSVALASYQKEIGWIDLKAESNVVAGIGELSTQIEGPGIFAILAGVVPQPLPAAFKLDDLNINRSLSKVWEFFTFIIRIGEDATVTVFVTNFGGQEGTYTANLKQDGVVVATQEVYLSPEQSQKITFDISGNETGDYIVEIGGISGELSSVLWINWWLIGGLSAAFILLVWAGWYYGYHRRRHKKSIAE